MIESEPPAPPITVEFEYEASDGREALIALVRREIGRRIRSRGGFGLLLFILLGIVFFMIFSRHSHAPPPRLHAHEPDAPRWIWLALVVGPWVLILTFFAWVIRVAWVKAKTSPTLLDRRWTLVADATAFVLSGANGRREHGWSAFNEVTETKNLYLLHMETFQAVIVPKRAFAQPTDAASFRRLAEGQVGPRISAFPVLLVKR